MQARPRAKSPELWGHESLLGGMAEEDTCFLVTKAGEKEAGKKELAKKRCIDWETTFLN